MMERKYLNITIIWIILAFSLFTIFIFFRDYATAFNVIIFLLISISLTFSYYLWEKEKEIIDMEKIFPVFLANLRKNIEVGVPLTQAFIDAAEQNYGKLTIHFKIFAKKLKSGISIPKSLEYLKRKFGASKKISNVIDILSNSVQSGYGLSSIIYSISEYMINILEVEQERKSILNQFTIMFYAVTIIFAVIVIVMIKVLIPILSQTEMGEFKLIINPCEFTPTLFQSGICSLYDKVTSLFREKHTLMEAYFFGLLSLLTFLQAFFGGIVIGLGVENSLIKGIIHSLILFSIVFFIFLLVGKIGLL